MSLSDATRPQYGSTNPSPAEQAEKGVQRYSAAVELLPEKEELYRELHASVWPDVVAALKRANIQNYSIHVLELGGKKYLFQYFEYVGDDPKRDFASIGQDPTTRDEWWPITDACQSRIEGTPEGEQWLPGEMVMHLP
ncbi:L-rhamnose mutarotase [Aeoliella sp. ICT_H6.2]|uniref:L-rhamnose mutarotase n=1 Tax=Aeoliella straminimaris TaxID=2954799 RepID=A0A9X2F9H0_9BACT|nr:L-rhamnose mutarotase [Aeoliella straminimaris]MCO6044103.1 L-rhamnose mutarotase [Aeoliella straminimaris]